jgi:protein-disulfide isomerase
MHRFMRLDLYFPERAVLFPAVGAAETGPSGAKARVNPFGCMRGLKPSPPSRLCFFAACIAFVALALAGDAARAQSPIQVLDASALHPPAGARVAIVEFADLQCPACAAANPTLKAAAANYKIPWVRHDFLIPYHNWSRIAAINARWFDSKSKALGDEYRDQVFSSQVSIYNPDSLAQFTQKFAQNHSIALPFAMDPQGKIVNDLNADIALGQRTGIKSTPTIFIVTAGSKGAPYTQVLVPATQLYTTIDQAIADTAPAGKTTVAKKAGSK